MGQDNFYEFTTLKLPLLLFWEEIINMVSLSEASASPHPTQPLSNLPFLSSLLSPCVQSGLYFQYFFSFPDRDSLKRASILRISLVEKWKLGPRWWKTRANRASSWGEPHSISGKRGGKVHIPYLDTERVGRSGSPVEWHAPIPEAQGRWDRMSLCVLGDWDHLVGLIPTFSSHQNTIFPLPFQSPLHTYSDISLPKEEKISKGVPLLITEYAANGNVLKGSGVHSIYLNVCWNHTMCPVLPWC